MLMLFLRKIQKELSEVMYKKTINCQSCEVKCDIIVRHSNFDEEMEVQFCPMCSADINDLDYTDWDEE